MDVTSYLLGKQASGGGGEVKNQNKNITITENGTTTVSADAGYTGLGTVGITTNVSGGGSDISEYFTTDITEENKEGFQNVYVKKFPPINISSNVTDYSYMFSQWPFAGLNFGNIDTSNVTSMEGMLSGVRLISSLDISKFNTGKVTSMASMFDDIPNVAELDVSGFNTENVTNMNRMFANCTSIQELDLSSFDTSKVEDMGEMFIYCENLQTINGSLDFSSCYNIAYMFGEDYALENLPTMSNIGRAFSTEESAYTYNYSFDVSANGSLTHASLMNIINGLYDIKSMGVQTQSLVLGENLSKLTQAEIDIATNKGWEVSELPH